MASRIGIQKMVLAGTLAGTLALAACSMGGSAAPVGLSPEAKAGYQLAIKAGCASCHGANGEGRIGPKWVGLADSQVPLADGTTVTADDAYLYESIKNPSAKRRRGVFAEMPPNQLTDEQIASIITYIRALTD